MKIPYVAGKWKVLFKPKKNGNYVNDHAIVPGPDGQWHLYGITGFCNNPYQERYFVHATGKNLDERFVESGRAIDRGTLAWSPGIMEKEGNYYMFYGPSPTSLAVSFDMREWFGTNVTLVGEPPMAAHRDHFIFKLAENNYLMYVTGVADKKGCLSLFSSGDLLTWNFEGYALTTGDNAPLRPACGATESPFVLKKDGLFYLFMTYTDCRDENYCNTLVFCSENPKDFGRYDGEQGAQPITVLQAHAPEILEENGRYFITTCGWRNKPNPHKGCVSVAPLEWK